MASRSSPLLKPTMSRLATTAPGPRSRPPFSRTSSTSSTRSNTSEDSLVATLKSLTPLDAPVDTEVGHSHTRSGSGGGNVNTTGMYQVLIWVLLSPCLLVLLPPQGWWDEALMGLPNGLDFPLPLPRTLYPAATPYAVTQ